MFRMIYIHKQIQKLIYNDTLKEHNAIACNGNDTQNRLIGNMCSFLHFC